MNQKVALVTGSAQGIGLGVARALAERGWLPHVVVRATPFAPALSAEFGAERVHSADLTGAGAAERVVAETLERSGRIDAIVHAVGPYATAPLSESPPALFQEMLDGNLFTALHVIRAGRQAIRDARGSWLFFGCAGLDRWRARRTTTAYIAAKSALLVTVRAMALEEAPFGVRVNMLSPGFVPHPDAARDTLDADLHARVPIGRTAQMREVASSAAWLLSEEAGHVVGQNLEVAGGWML